MRWLLDGNEKFRREAYPRHKKLFAALAGGQRPSAIIITCADSRVDPNLVTDSMPGDLFHLRNAGNLVPPHPINSNAAATIEFGVRALGIRDIVVCGHSDCGAMKGLLNLDSLTDLPNVRHCLETGALQALRVLERDGLAPDDPKALPAVIEENVLVQLDNLRTHAVVAETGDVKLHGAVFDLATASFALYDDGSGAFVAAAAQEAGESGTGSD